jgi:dipeptidyl aminopeptidase/acylaminoacyl peptidase
MSKADVEHLLADATPPDRQAAEERAWRVVSAAFEERPHVRGRLAGRRRSALALALALVLVLGALALSPAGAALAAWVGDAFDQGREDADPALVSLPAAGRLLATSGQGPWIVHRDGSKRRLGAYEDATWSPAGLFVAVTTGRELVAVEPDGDLRWSLARSGPVSRPAWSSDGFRIAYLSGRALRVVAGDGTGDALLVRRAAPVRPAWRPGAGHVLAHADLDGRIVVADADSGRRLWRTGPGPLPSTLAWTPDGRRLLALSPGSLRILDRHGSLSRTLAPLAGARFEALAIHPDGNGAALIRHFPAERRSEAVDLPLRAGIDRRLFAGDGRFSDLAWSPDGRWLLIAWPDADQWLFVRSTDTPKILATSNVSRQLDPGGPAGGPFPTIDGWCCPAQGR